MGAMILSLLGAIPLSLLIRWLGVEIGVWHKPICRWLVRIAAGRLPAEEGAAAESEWLQIIEDLRSPTAQLLHSLSYAVSAFRIRRAIVPETRARSINKGLMLGQAAGTAMATGVFAVLLGYYDTDLPQRLISNRGHVVLFVVMFAIVTYVNYRTLMWSSNRRARRRASTPIE
jgi:hypothetical protein